MSSDWAQLFLKKDPDYDVHTMTEADFWELLHQSRQQYTSIVGTDDPDLSGFKAVGAKMITWYAGSDRSEYRMFQSNLSLSEGMA